MPVHDEAARGFERGAGDYEAARPSYPDGLVELLIRELDIGSGSRVLDLAAGTGKLTRLLVPTGADLVAVEPVAAMRATLADTVPSAEALDGTAEAIPLADASVDAVVVAQAFHWFDAPAALGEIRRVLRPGGGLALVWNVRDTSVDWVKRFGEILVERGGGEADRGSAFLETGKPYAERQDWAAIVADAGGFTTVATETMPYEQQIDPDVLVARAASTSFVSALPDDQREKVLDGVRDLARTHPDLVAREAFGFPYVTTAHWCHKTS